MAGSWGVELWNCCSAAPPTHKRQQVQRRELQLVAVSAMLIDCKYEEIWAPEVNDFIFISDSAYTREQILAMEKGILNKLQWNLTIPTPYVFIMMLSASADNKSDKEYGLVAYASAVYAARPNPHCQEKVSSSAEVSYCDDYKPWDQ
uniref:Cyclin N-terminal domain-containing protein n=1 Tax=Oryza nivara TaxID=4536 RepID=A0A0E0GQ07_ORYNI